MKRKVGITTIALLAFAAGAPLTTSAADKIWIGPYYGGWYEADNWLPSGAPESADNILYTNGYAMISPPFVMSNSFTWDQGVIEGKLTVAPGAVLNLVGNGTMGEYLSNGAGLTNAGTAHFIGSSKLEVPSMGWPGSHIENLAGAVFELQGDQLIIGGSTEWFANAGTVRKSGGSGKAQIGNYSYPLRFKNSGTVEVLSGTLSFGSYAEMPSANLAVSLGGTSTNDYGRVAFETAQTFVGQFTVSTRNGFRPNPGDTFEVLTYPSATTTFTCLNGLDLGGGILLVPTFEPTRLTLTATSYTPSPQPQLFITRQPGAVRITWTLGFPGWRLESTTNLANAVWETVPPQCGNEALVTFDASSRCFRLAQ